MQWTPCRYPIGKHVALRNQEIWTAVYGPMCHIVSSGVPNFPTSQYDTMAAVGPAIVYRRGTSSSTIRYGVNFKHDILIRLINTPSVNTPFRGPLCKRCQLPPQNHAYRPILFVLYIVLSVKISRTINSGTLPRLLSWISAYTDKRYGLIGVVLWWQCLHSGPLY